MNKDNAKDFLPLVQALAEGKTIQFNKGEEGAECWTDYTNVSLTLPASRYRIKPEPRKPREFWMALASSGKPFDSGISGPPVNISFGEVIRVREIIEE